MRDPIRRKPVTEEQRKRLSEAGKARWAKYHEAHPLPPRPTGKKKLRHNINPNHGLGG